MTTDPGQPSRSGRHRAFQRLEATDELLADDCARLRALSSRQGVPEKDAGAYLATLGDRAARDAAINWYRAAGRSEIHAEGVPAVLRPTLYVWGDTDATVGREAAEGTQSFVDAPYRFVELSGVGHFVTDEALGALPPLLVEHLRAGARTDAVRRRGERS